MSKNVATRETTHSLLDVLIVHFSYILLPPIIQLSPSLDYQVGPLAEALCWQD